MRRLMVVVIKTLVAKFYEQNAGLLLFIFFLMFGIVESGQIINYHLSLVYGMLEAPIFLAVVCLIWTAYMLRTVQFTFGQLAKPENAFLVDLAKIKSNRSLLIVLVSQTMMYEPVLFYTILIVGVAINTGHFVVAIFILGYHAVLMMSSSWLINKKIRETHIQRNWSFLPVIRWNVPKPFPYFFLGMLTNKNPFMLLTTKIFSLLCVLGMMQIELGHYDMRVALLGICFGLVAHAVIVFEFRRHEDRSLVFVRGLPISLGHRYAYLMAVYLILFLPEAILLIVNNVPVGHVLAIVVFATMSLLYLHSKLYVGILNMDKHIRRTFIVFLLSFLLVMSKVFWLGLLMGAGMAWWIVKKKYYKYEA